MPLNCWSQCDVTTALCSIDRTIWRDARVAKGMGWLNMVGTLPRVIVPVGVPLFLALNGMDNYPTLFLAAALIAAVGAFGVLAIKTA